MKKITKILLLVLSLSLICGIIAVAAFAETETAITGIRVDNSGDFENMTVTEIKTGSGQVITNLDSDNNAAKYVTFKYQGSGEGKIVTNPVDNNTYITVDFAGTTGSTHYIQTYTKPNGWGTYTADTNEYYNEIKYYVADFDVAWFDVANYNGAGSFNPYAVYTNAAGSGRVAVDGNFGITFSKADGKVVAKFKGGDGTGYEVGNEKWSHVTWIMEPIIITDDAGENIKIKQYLAIDGTVVGVHEWTSTTAASAVYNGDRTRIYSLDIRFNPFGSAGAAGCTDNFNFRTFLPEYNGNLADVLAAGVGADLTTFESNLYDADAMPAALPEASVGEGDAKTYYATVEEAIAAAAGATVTLESNVSGVEINEPVVIACGDYTITDVKVGSGLVGGYDANTKTWSAIAASDFAITYTTADGLAGLNASTDAFKTALTNVADGGVITLYADTVYTPTANVQVLKDVTLNLNGHVLDMLTTYKGQYFQIGGGKTFTVLGEEEGSALIAGYSKGANAAGGTLFSSTGTNPTITLKGKGLFVSCAALYGAWGNYHATINIEDCYLNHNGATENSYNIYISSGSGNAAAFTLNIKNAVVKGLTAGVYSGSTTVQTTVNIENSVILSQILTASSATTNINAVVNVKGNSYIVGSLNKATNVNVTGENNYFTTNDWVDKATFEEDVELVDADLAMQHDNYSHPWVVSAANAEWDHEATLAISKIQESVTYTYKAESDVITGIRVDASGDLEDPLNSTINTVTTGSVTTDLDKDNGAAKPLMFKHQIGGTPVLVTNPYDNNTYVTVNWGTSTSSSGHFLEHYTAINGWGTYTDDSKEYFDEFKYYVVDFDVAWFDVASAQSGYFYPYTVYTNAAGTGRKEANAYLGLNFTKDNGEMKASFRGGDGTKYALGNEEWSHVTWIMEPIASTDGEGNKSLTVKQYLAIDGIVVGTYEWTNVFDVTAMYNSDPTKLYTLDVRLDVFGRKASSGCVDNYNFRTFLPEYNGNLATVLAGGVNADLTTFESNLYDAAKMPAVYPEASVGEGDQKEYYLTVEEAIAAAAGATVTLESNVLGTVEINQAAVIKYGDYTIADVKTGDDIISAYDEATKTWTFSVLENYLITYTTANGLAGLTASSTDAFKTAINEVIDGGVITLYGDVAYKATVAGNGAVEFTVNKSVTINLNGHVLDLLTDTKNTLFKVGAGKTFTVLGEEEGSALIHGYSKGVNLAGGTLFGSGDNSVITLKGKGLFVSCAALYGQWSNVHVTINIEDCYLNHCGAYENTYNLYISNSGTNKAYTLNIKNAVVKGLTAGLSNASTNVDSVINIENSVILSQMLTSATANAKTIVNVKGNSYIVGSLANAAAINVTGENNYFTTSDWVSKATFENGVNLASVYVTKAHDNYSHPWVVSAANAEWDREATLVISKITESQTYTYQTTTGPVDYKFEYTSGGNTYSYADLTMAINAAPAGATIKMLCDVTIEATTAVATITKEITVDLDGHHLQIIQNASGVQIFVNTTAPVTFKNGRISCAASYEYGQRTAYYDIADPLFVANTVAADIRLEGVSTFTGGIFHNKISGSKITVNGGYHNQITLTKGLDRGIVIAQAGITSYFKNATIYIEYTGALLVGKSTENMSFTYDNCVVVLKDSDHRFIREANDTTFVYFNNSDVYGAFAQPTNSTGGQFTSANLIFGEGTTWGYPSIEGFTVVTPSTPNGYVIEATASATVNYDKYAFSGTFYNGNFVFPAVTTGASFTVTYEVINKNTYEVTSGSTVTYYDDTYTLPDVIAAAASGSTIKLLKNVTYNTNAAIAINKALTFDLNGRTLTLGHSAKEQTFRITAAVTVKFMNGNIATVPVGDYAGGNKTFAFLYVFANANIVLDNVNGTVSSLAYSYSYTYTITINGGTYHIDNNFTDMNTSGFISGQTNFTANVNNATIFVNSGSLIGASSYKKVASLMNNKSTTGLTYEGIKSQISTNVTFTGCSIISTNFTKSIIGDANEFTKITFNGCNLYGNIMPSKNASDNIKYAVVGGKYYTSVSVCTCTTFTDAGGDSKCDSCGKYDPSVVQTITIGVCPASNIVIGEGTMYSSAATASNFSLANSLVVSNVSVTKDFGGTLCLFDRKVDYIKVTWYDENGNVLKTEKVDGSFDTLVGRAPAHDAAGGVTNGWYKIGGYVTNGWTNVLGGTEAVDFASYDLTGLTEDLNFYPQANGDQISAYLSAAMYNLSIAGSIRNNFYIPDTPENVEILGVFVGDNEIEGNRVLYRDYNNAPVYYTMYVINAVGAVEFTKVTEFVVKYRVNGDIELEQVYNISAEKYANIIYKDSQKTSGNVYNTQSYNVTADLVRYSYLLSVYTKVEDDNLTALYNKMKSLCSALPSDNDLAGSVANVSAFAGMGSIAFEASAYNPRWKFTLNSSAQITDIKITLEGYRNGIYADRTNFGTHTYGINNVVKDSNGYITSAYSTYIPVYNIGEPFTITFTKADGSEVSGTYDMKAYYSAVGASNAITDFLKSVIALSKSTIAYKFPEGKITINDVAEFWECDHAPAEPITPVVSGNYNFKPRYCSKCDSYLFYYEDYGAIADGKSTQSRTAGVSGTNDYEAIYWTHMNANQWAQRPDLNGDKHTAVIGNSNPSVQKKYYIGVPEGRGIYKIDADNDGIVETTYKNGANLGAITVATDTSWNGVYFIMDDNALCLNADSANCTCGRAHHGYARQSIFSVDEYGAENYTVDLLNKMATTLKPGDTNIGYAPGRKMLVYITSKSRQIWYRYGDNADNGVDANEILIVDEFGNIDPTTPVQWDYPTITTAKGYSVDTAPIKISGLDANGNINSYYENFVNLSTQQSIPHYEQLSRNIAIKRSNATVEGVHHYFTEAAYSEGSTKRTAYAFINVTFCSNATIKDMSVVNHNGYPGDSGVSQGSYEFSGGDANATSWINCVTRNLFSSAQGVTQAYPIYRGLFGTNRMRNMYLKDCYLNSFDAHTGANNVTIEDSTFEHMNFVGGGKITLKNVIIYTTTNGSVVNLREDYGSVWKGDLDIDGLEVRYTTTSNYKPSQITLIKGTYNNQYYGFGDGLYMPQNVTINNFHTRSYTASVSNGVRTETLASSVDASSMKVYYYYNINSLDADNVATTTAPGTYKPEDKQSSGNGTSVLNCTTNLTITNSVTFQLPTGDFWKNMTFNMNGSEYAWEETKIGSWVISAGFKKQ